MKCLGVVGLLVLTFAPQPVHGDTEAAAQPIEWVDDLGKPLPMEEMFEVCWIRGLENDCSRVSGRSLPNKLPAFDLLQMESAGYGPVRVKAQDLQRTGESYRLRVPRKAWLSVKDLPEEIPVTLSLYPQDAPEAPRPAARLGPLDATAIRIPAGAFIASLSSKGAAPHLSLIDVGPGDRLSIPYQRQPGWSLVLRASDHEIGSPVAGARVEIAPAPGYSESPEPERKARKTETGAAGLVVFSGLREPIVEATLEHPTFLPVHLAGLSSSRGTFAFQDVLLPRGGGVDVSILLEGKAAPGAECTLLRYLRDAPGSKAPPKEVFRGTSDEKGLCQARRLREGTYWLRVRPPKRLLEDHAAKTAHVDRVLQILEGQNTWEEVVLQPTRLEGTVRLGEVPAPAYEVMVLDPNNKIKNATSKDALVVAQTDEDGRYEATLWTTGEFFVLVQNPGGSPGAMKRIRLDGGTETIDFQLAPEEIAGRVVDGEGKPVENAGVQLRWDELSYRLAMSDRNGDFSFPVEKEGRAELTAKKEGYQASPPRTLEVGPGSDPQPVVLTLARWPEIEARLVNAGGRPVLGGWAAIYKLEMQEPVWVGTAETGADGSLRLPVVPGQAHRLFFGGPGCPLGARLIERLPEPSTRLEVPCAAAPANLQVTLKTSEGTPREGLGVLLAQGRVIYPQIVVAAHLARLGLPATTDGSGRLALVALEPGEYRLYLADVTSPFNILVGAPQGFLTTATLAPWSTRAAEIRLEVEPPG